jgi:hypothetical protein
MSRIAEPTAVVSIPDDGARAGVRRERRGLLFGVLIAAVGVLVPLGGVSAARAQQVSQTFTYTGAEQAFTVPAGVFSVQVLRMPRSPWNFGGGLRVNSLR